MNPPVVKRPVVFTPMKGALSLCKLVVHRFGLQDLWEGEDGFEGVARQKLAELGVPSGQVELTGPQSMTVRQMAERGGFIKRKRPQRRVR